MYQLLISTLSATMIFGAYASANEAKDLGPMDKFFTVGEVQLIDEGLEDTATTGFDPMDIVNDCSDMKEGGSGTRDIEDGSIGWGDIEAIGQKIWKIIEANRPVVNIKVNTAHALPRGLKCWTDLNGWQAPQSRRYRVVYKNLYGMSVVDYSFRVIFSHGGGRSGMGMYVANATIVPADLSVIWGYTFNAEAQVGQALNLGTAESPIAGLEISMKWSVETALVNNQSAVSYFMQGDGTLKQLE